MEHPFSILLVEDNDAHALITERSLRKAGLANPILRTTDGDEALDLLLGRGRARPDPPVGLVLLDLRLPRVDGLEVLREIRRREELKRLPVVMLTTSGEERDMAEAMKNGANSFVTKPVEFQDFAAHVTQIGLYWVLTDRLPKPPLG